MNLNKKNFSFFPNSFMIKYYKNSNEESKNSFKSLMILNIKIRKQNKTPLFVKRRKEALDSYLNIKQKSEKNNNYNLLYRNHIANTNNTITSVNNYSKNLNIISKIKKEEIKKNKKKKYKNHYFNKFFNQNISVKKININNINKSFNNNNNKNKLKPNTKIFNINDKNIEKKNLNINNFKIEYIQNIQYNKSVKKINFNKELTFKKDEFLNEIQIDENTTNKRKNELNKFINFTNKF